MDDLQQMAINKMAKLLREAKEEHAKYEERLERKDENWSQWYAKYVLERLGESQEPTQE